MSAMALHRNNAPHHTRSRFVVSNFIPLFTLLCLTVLLLFKVDMFISEATRVAKTNVEIKTAGFLSRDHKIENQTQLLVIPNGTFHQNFEITWGDGRTQILNDGELLTLSLDKSSGSGFQSRNVYLFGKIHMDLKLIPGNSAGTVTAYYLSSEDSNHDEIDFEFLGNSSGEPYTIHTNVFCQGKGMREQQFFLWFDPTKDFHTYSILWNPQRIVFYVDDTPIREFKNAESLGVPFPNKQPMRLYSSLWNADDWATQGGRVKTDWNGAPFVSSYRNFSADSCFWTHGSSSCNYSLTSDSATIKPWLNQGLGVTELEKLRWVQEHHMIYNYCKDSQRFPQGPAPECKLY